VHQRILLLFYLLAAAAHAQPSAEHGLTFRKLPSVWDESLPLGNGMLGAMVWHRGGNLRFSLDRADLWDERPVVDFKVLNYRWVIEQHRNDNYKAVQQYGDVPYEEIAWPTKIPGAALEFRLPADAQNSLNLATAKATATWTNGTELTTFVHAVEPIGVFRFRNAPEGLTPEIVPPVYRGSGNAGNASSVEGQSLERLGYEQGDTNREPGVITFRQKGALGFEYEVAVRWERKGRDLFGVWTIQSGATSDAAGFCKEAMKKGYRALEATHHNWWKAFWGKSEVRLPEPNLQRQYHLELYKLGSVARKGAPAITLQGVWTADNGKLPPWKGDFHHDLNTQLSYWPSYTGNHLEIAETFTDWLWSVREENRNYTRAFFGVEGLNVPGVTTLTGKPMGGWIQYSFSPTVSAWLAQHFYWQWKYSGDPQFLKNRAYPYLKDVATFLENILEERDGVLKFPLGSSPEYNDNRREAWFTEWTNYDLALVKNAFTMAAAGANALGVPAEAEHWRNLLRRLPGYDVNETGLTIAPGQNLDESHRHIAQLMALHPLGLINPGTAESDTVIARSLRRLEHMGTRWWTGYSFSWVACLYARAGRGAEAARNLRIFAENFCLPNSFHANGDQKGGQYSNFTYRPFTLEGNFAFAQGVHEMLLQSHEGITEVFPALPPDWKNVSFRDLRTEDGLLITAELKKGRLTRLEVSGNGKEKIRVRIPAEVTGEASRGNAFVEREIQVSKPAMR